MEQGAKVLVVDDEPNVLRSLVQYLTIEEFNVETASNGVEALEKVESFSPELILLDVMMPGLDGPGVLSLLQEDPVTASVPVVFITARTQEQEIAHLKQLGARGVIAKPFDPMTLAEQVRSFLDG